ncbi:MAG TPA: hypothetical protein VKR61_10755 [Bryobacteraceae bacterium]|nr:hypothetical protein [Bryobacteraceae bacterium]
MRHNWLVAALVLSAAWAQEDPVQQWDRRLREATGGRFAFTFEERTWAGSF